MKTYLVRVVVNNAGLDFEDDVDFVCIRVPEEISLCDVEKAMTELDKELHEEDDYGNTLYDEKGWNAQTLMDALCDTHKGWSWEFMSYDMNFSIG